MTKSLMALVEVPAGSSYKYEYKGGRFLLDRPLKHAYPENYGYIPNTVWEDGDPLDVFVISNEPINPLSHVKLDLIGVVRMLDNGESDDKLVAVIKGSKKLNKEELDDRVNKIMLFLSIYKKGIKLKGFYNKVKALQTLEKGYALHNAG